MVVVTYPHLFFKNSLYFFKSPQEKSRNVSHIVPFLFLSAQGTHCLKGFQIGSVRNICIFQKSFSDHFSVAGNINIFHNQEHSILTGIHFWFGFSNRHNKISLVFSIIVFYYIRITQFCQQKRTKYLQSFHKE